jgi:hypothetical protein
MNAFPNVRFFRLGPDGARCDARGLFVGPAPLLRRTGGDRWTPRDAAAIDADLSAVYRLPIETTAIRGRLIAIADALTRGDIPRAAIMALHIRFPDPPGLEKGPAERMALAAQLAEIGLLKGSWDPDKHPRLGGPPNAGWFAPKDGGTEPTAPREEPEEQAAEDAEERRFFARGLLRGMADGIRESGDVENWMGYELHHIVEQNPANIVKSPISIVVAKFGRKAIDAPSNLVWVPKLKHELITGFYNSADEDFPTRRHRDVVNGMDFAAQRAAGLDTLRRYGVLK